MTDIAALTQRLFDQTRAKLVAAGVSLPSAQFIAQGVPAWDGEQFTVSFLGMNPGQPGAQAQYQFPQEQVYFGQFSIELVRNAPGVGTQGTPPPAAVQAAAAASTAADVQALQAALIAISGEGIVAQFGVRFEIVSINVVGPEGFMVGAVANVSIGLM